MDAVAELELRVAHLDAQLGDPRTASRPLSGFEDFIRVIGTITPSDAMANRISPSAADAVVRKSALLSYLESVAAEVVAGPLRPDAQFWIGTGKPSTAPTPHRGLDRRLFVEIAAGGEPTPSTKPFFLGLYTSTGLLATHGMWELYLDTTRSSLFPPPWEIWMVRPVPGVDVLEIASATAWAALVSEHPLRHEGLLYPDWRSVSRTHDAVHVTLRAIAATQGVCLRAGNETLAPAYWDVESTLWLRWCFEGAELVGLAGEE